MTIAAAERFGTPTTIPLDIFERFNDGGPAGIREKSDVNDDDKKVWIIYKLG